MPGHRNRPLNKALWSATDGRFKGAVARNGGWLTPAQMHTVRQTGFNYLKERRSRRLEEERAKGSVPDFWRDFMPHVKIAGDGKYRGPIAFKPYGYQEDVLNKLLTDESIVWLKERQIGASWLLAAFSYWKAAYHEGENVALVSMGQRESDLLLNKVVYIHDHLPPELFRESSGWRNMDFIGTKSKIVAFPSTRSAGVSYTFSLIVQDEAARHPYGEQNYYEYLPAIANGGQIVICSTSNPELGPSGFFYDRVMETMRKDNDYTFVFSGRYSRPEHDEAFYERQKKLFNLSEAEFNSHYPAQIHDAFMGRSGVVYDMFDPQLHVRQQDPMPWEDYTYRIAGIDPGGGDPTAVVVIGVWQDHATGTMRFHQPEHGELYKRGPVPPSEIIQWLSQWHNRAPLTRIYDGSTGGAVLLASIQQYFGKRAWPANKDRAGLGTVASLLESQYLTFHASNTNLINEFSGYRWIDRVDPHDKQRYRTATPVDNHADALDGLRYAIVSFLRKLESTTAAGGMTPRDRLLANTTENKPAVAINWR